MLVLLSLTRSNGFRTVTAVKRWGGAWTTVAFDKHRLTAQTRMHTQRLASCEKLFSPRSKRCVTNEHHAGILGMLGLWSNDYDMRLREYTPRSPLDGAPCVVPTIPFARTRDKTGAAYGSPRRLPGKSRRRKRRGSSSSSNRNRLSTDRVCRGRPPLRVGSLARRQMRLARGGAGCRWSCHRVPSLLLLLLLLLEAGANRT